MEKTIDLKFIGIDDWNRPVFYNEVSKSYHGSTEKLFEWGASEPEVLAQITTDDICYFGKSFNCEPNGGIPKFSYKFIKG